MMTSQTSRAERTPVVEAVNMGASYAEVSLLVNLPLWYYYSTASLNRLNPSISSTDSQFPAPAVRTKSIGGVRKDSLLLTEAMEGRVNCPGEWKGMFNSVEIFIHYWDVDQHQINSEMPTYEYLENQKWGLFQSTTTTVFSLVSVTILMLILRSVHDTISMDRNRMVDIGLQHNITLLCQVCCV